MKKKTSAFLFVVVLAGHLATADMAAATNTVAKQVKRPVPSAARNPATVPIKDVPGLPRVLVIGDSIAMGYTLPLRELLAGKANLHYPIENCHTSGQILERLDVYLGDQPWDVIQFNCGIHDITRTNAAGKAVKTGESGVIKVPIEKYRENLGIIVSRLQRTGASLIWRTTTPVTNNLPHRPAAEITRYNTVAKEVMLAHGIPITDLNEMINRRGNPKWKDGVHFTPEGCREIARDVLPDIESALAKQSAKSPSEKSPGARRSEFGVPPLSGPAPQPPSGGKSPVNSMKAARQAAANRQRRIIFNNDGGEPAIQMKSPSAKELLDLRTSALAGTQVDSIFYCSRCSGFSVFTHFTKVGQVFTSVEGRYTNNQMPALLKAGIDPLKVMVDFSKQHGMESFWSMRMNDTHDGQHSEFATIVFHTNTLKITHPEYLMGTEKQRPKIGSWTAVNYGLPEIRELAFRYFEEVCNNYDVEGVELDFYRHPVYFKSTTRGEPATDEERAQMTELLRRIRTMADEVGRKRGRPILIAVHCPDSVEYSRAMGLDLENWMANDLLDLWMAGGTFHFNDWEYSVALARKHGVKVYPSLDDPRVKDDVTKKMRHTPAAYRARALQVWTAGADGIYMFNAPDTGTGAASPLWRELGNPQALTKLDRDYFASFLGAVGSASGNYPLAPFMKLELLDSVNFKSIAPGKTAAARLNVAESFGKDQPVKLNLRLRFKSPPDAKSLEVSFNGEPLKSPRPNGEWLEFSLPPQSVHRGDNQTQVKLSAVAKKKTDWTDLLLEVR